MKFKKYYVLALVVICYTISAAAQKVEIDQAQVEKHITYLASDELKGRKTGQEGNWVATNYIADHFKSHGLSTFQSTADYLQKIPLKKFIPPSYVNIELDTLSFSDANKVVLTKSTTLDQNIEAVFVGYGTSDDLEDLDLKGKLAIALPGNGSKMSPQAMFSLSLEKRKEIGSRGAVGLLEVFNIAYPWGFFKSYFGSGRLVVEKEVQNDVSIYGWIKPDRLETIKSWKKGQKIASYISVTAKESIPIEAHNVVGYLPGTDPKLSGQYMVVTAHFDHVGTKTAISSSQDSIFNGARDNAIGTTAVLSAAQYFSEQPSPRPIIFIALNGEESGMLGSKYFADHPPIALNKMVYNINSDGAGYHDTTMISIIGYGRLGLDSLYEEIAKEHSLGIIANPEPQQNLFDRSDNVSFAAKGIPAVNISPGLQSFNEEIRKYYHRVEDEASSLDFKYVTQFVNTFIGIVEAVAYRKEKPVWTQNDKYRSAFEKLYVE